MKTIYTKTFEKLSKAIALGGLFIAQAATSLNAQTPCDATFTSSSDSVGHATFTAAAPLANPNTTHFMWAFGDGSNANGQSVTHNYNHGAYSYSLWVIDSTAGCYKNYSDSIYIWGNSGSGGTGDTTGTGGTGDTTVVTNPCSASFVYSADSSGTINFTSTSVNTTANTTFTWNFGDSNVVTTTVGYVSHTFSSNNTYMVSLYISDSLCNSSTYDTVIVGGGNPNTSCGLSVSFSMYGNGVADFNVTSVPAIPIPPTTMVEWNFGDGSAYAYGLTASHTYTGSGSYMAHVIITDSVSGCYQSSTLGVFQGNGSNGDTCQPVANFYLYQDSLTAHTFNIIPNISSNITSMTWFWGDGSSTTGFTPTHTYANAGTYMICLQAFSNCGDTVYTCDTTFLQKSMNSMITVNVQTPVVLSVKNVESKIATSLFPNPTSGNAILKVDVEKAANYSITVSDISGNVVRSINKSINVGENKIELEMENLSNGIYLVNIKSEGIQKNLKLVKN